MSLTIRRIHVSVWFVALFSIIVGNVAYGAEPPKSQACASPGYRQFDFWVGDWDAFDVDKPTKQVARVQVDLILDGCVLRENYEGADGHTGQSFSIYDFSRKVWHQSWVTNRGELLIVEGHSHEGEMVLSGIEQKTDGSEIVRGTWKAVREGVRETAVTSTDGGETWKPWFDLIFRHHKPNKKPDSASQKKPRSLGLEERGVEKLFLKPGR